MSLDLLMRRVRTLARFPDKRVLVRGESGSGKSRVAKAYADAAKRTLVHVNCALLAPERAAADLFGHVAGAYTGAQRERKGLVSEADAGVLWLDEVHRLPADAQGMLLTWLDTGKFRPLGSTSELQVQCAVMCSSNEDLRALAIEGKFAADLFGRFDRHRLQIPPLRDRPDDAVDVATEEAGEYGVAIAPEAIAWIRSGAWEDLELPLNARRLQAVIGEAAIEVIMRGDNVIRLADLGHERTLATVPDEERTAALLRAHEEISSQELAEALGVHRATAVRWAKAVGAVKRGGRKGGWHLP